VIHTGDREDHDPYIEASQAQMVYYVNDEMSKDWSVVVHLKPRELYDMGDQIDTEICPDQDLSQFSQDSDDPSLIREDADDEEWINETQLLPYFPMILNRYELAELAAALLPYFPKLQDIISLSFSSSIFIFINYEKLILDNTVFQAFTLIITFTLLRLLNWQ
jgi:hypothetical protein